MPERRYGIVCPVLVAAALAAACNGVDVARDAATGSSASPATFVGSGACAGCHAAEHTAWSDSDHDRALAPARADTVLGDFDDASIAVGDVVSRFFRRGDEYVVETESADGALETFRVVHAFGVDPLQQYLVEYSGGRLQALTLAWDTRPADAGGQRWFSLHGSEAIAPGDPLHWTGPLQNWNSMCADCHSTGVVKGYELENDRYTTSFAEEDVGCESCHGPGSLHAASPASAPLELGPVERAWVREGAMPIATRTGETPRDDEPAQCASCHSRRAQLADAAPLAHYLDTYRPEWLAEGLYFDDGQVREEVYVYGSFLQSPMHAAGVTCSDCHEPHALTLRAEGDALCARCHAADTFAVESHHRHGPASGTGTADTVTGRSRAGDGPAMPRCVDCHMRAATFMQVDDRRDHSFRVPRPDLSLSTGSPNACNDCHVDRDAAWAAATVAGWFPDGRTGTPHFGEAFASVRDWQTDALTGLLPVAIDPDAADIIRATALAGLGGSINDAEPATLDMLAADPSPLVRLALIDASRELEPERRAALVQRFLSDAPRALRIAAAEALQSVRTTLGSGRQADLDAALGEAVAARRFGSDRPEGLLGLATIAAIGGQAAEARGHLEDSIERFPWFVPAYVNLADLERANGRNDAALAVVEAGLEAVPDSDALFVARGLALVRLGRAEESVDAFGRAVAVAPDAPYNTYLHGVALHSTGARDQAIEVLEAAGARWPAYADIWYALATMMRDAGDLDRAVEFARRGRAAVPGDRRFDALLAAFGAD